MPLTHKQTAYPRGLDVKCLPSPPDRTRAAQPGQRCPPPPPDRTPAAQLGWHCLPPPPGPPSWAGAVSHPHPGRPARQSCHVGTTARGLRGHGEAQAQPTAHSPSCPEGTGSCAAPNLQMRKLRFGEREHPLCGHTVAWRQSWDPTQSQHLSESTVDSDVEPSLGKASQFHSVVIRQQISYMQQFCRMSALR